LFPGDKLVALQPISSTDRFTLYHTSAPITVDGPQLQPVAIEENLVQTLTVAPSNPLMLFNLDVALEWDARNDNVFMSRLHADLRRTSEILYDWSDGQIALGDITLYHDAKQRQFFPDPDTGQGWDLWSYAHVRIYSSNRLRPNADQGGGVLTDTIDPDFPDAEPYRSGQVRMPPSWNRFGNSAGELGEDWPRTLAHELGHYLLFLDDNYLGLNENGVLTPVSGCLGAMADPYRDDYSEFHPRDSNWESRCTDTLSQRERQRADWETIRALYPEAGLQAPATYNANPGPALLPLAVTQITEAPITEEPETLATPYFLLQDAQTSGTITAGGSARAFLFHADSNWLTDLGRPVVDQLEAYGAIPGDRICAFDLDAGRQGCTVATTGNQPLVMAATPDWRPELIVTPVNSTTLDLSFTNRADSPFTLTSLQARVFPIDRPATEPVDLVLQSDDSYSVTVAFDLPVFEGYVHVVASDGDSTREVLVDYALRGNPGRKWASRAPRGDPGRKWASRAPRNNPGRKWASRAPVLSGDGQAIIYTNAEFTEDAFFVIQSVAEPPLIPTWFARVGQIYRVTATPNAPSLDDASISIGYLGRDVPEGAEAWLRLYVWNDEKAKEDPTTGWEQLPTEVNREANVLAAQMRGPGVYAIFSVVPAAVFDEIGWDRFSYPLPDDRPVGDALASIEGKYTLVYHDGGVGANQRWRLYAPDAPAYVSDLEYLEFNQSYEIYVTEPGDLVINPQAPASEAQLATMSAALLQPEVFPAPFYGEIQPGDAYLPVPGAEVVARVGVPDGPICGQGATLEHEGQIVYRILVVASSEQPGCGSLGAPVYFTVDSHPIRETGSWSNTQTTMLKLTPVHGDPPTASTDPATVVTTSGVLFNGIVNANGETTTVTFEWGTSSGSYPNSVVANPDTVSGSSDTLVSANLAGLVPGTTYYFRVVATNSSGTTHGEEHSFTTLKPSGGLDAVTHVATDVTTSGALLHGTVNANGETTTVTFEWGTSSGSYPHSIKAIPSTVSGSNPTSVSSNLVGLVPGTTYYFRVVATNSSGATHGEEHSFTTPARAYQLYLPLVHR
jgi:hypothetical protein